MIFFGVAPEEYLQQYGMFSSLIPYLIVWQRSLFAESRTSGSTLWGRRPHLLIYDNFHLW